MRVSDVKEFGTAVKYLRNAWTSNNIRVLMISTWTRKKLFYFHFDIPSPSFSIFPSKKYYSKQVFVAAPFARGNLFLIQMSF